MSTMRRNTDRKKRKRELEGFAARLKQLRENNNLTPSQVRAFLSTL